MSGKYKHFGKKQFEYELRALRLGFITCITEEWIASGKETWEHIYKVSTKNKAVDIIIYSSVDIRTGFVRDLGTDAVRLVLRFTGRRGEIFKRLGKRYRMENLFKHLAFTIKEAQATVFDLDFKQFTPYEKEDKEAI